MAEINKRQYNLHSTSNSVQLPVEIHMASDSDFISKLSKISKIWIQMNQNLLSFFAVRWWNALTMNKTTVHKTYRVPQVR